jgi:hypothetical protein
MLGGRTVFGEGTERTPTEHYGRALGNWKRRRHVSLSELVAFDWDAGVDHETRFELAEEGIDGSTHRTLELFELVDRGGTPHEEWAPEDADGWRRRVVYGEAADLPALLRGGRRGSTAGGSRCSPGAAGSSCRRAGSCCRSCSSGPGSAGTSGSPSTGITDWPPTPRPRCR